MIKNKGQYLTEWQEYCDAAIAALKEWHDLCEQWKSPQPIPYDEFLAHFRRMVDSGLEGFLDENPLGIDWLATVVTGGY